MKIVDEKGRLFGINLIDFTVIAFLLLLIPAILISRRNASNAPEVIRAQPNEFVETLLSGNFIKIEPYLISIISVGDKETGEAGEIIGEIVWLGEPTAYTSSFNIGGKTQIKGVDYALRTSPAKLKLKLEVRGRDLFYKEYQILVDAPFLFTTKDYSVQFVPQPESTREKQKDQ